MKWRIWKLVYVRAQPLLQYAMDWKHFSFTDQSKLEKFSPLPLYVQIERKKYNPTFSYPFDFILNSVYMVYFNKNITIQYNRPTQEAKLTISWKLPLLCLSSVGHLRSWVSGLHGNRKRFSLSPAHQQQLPAVNFSFQFLVWNCHHELLRFSSFNF